MQGSDYSSKQGQNEWFRKEIKDFSHMEEEEVQKHRQQLSPLFSDEVENTILTPFQGYALVKHGGVFDVVKLGDGSPQIVTWEEVENMPQLKEWCEDFFD